MPKDGRNGKARVGIIGCGGVATSSHAPGLKRLQEEGLCEEALNVQRVIDGLYQSAETGKLVEVS